ncbi:MAG: NAD(+) synthase [Bacillota bacterium]|nr:NAD(+) synthase [Bacillota bacterium]
MRRYQYYKVAAATPKVWIGNPKRNKEEILKIIKMLPSDTQLVVFPELCLSGYTCQDLFYEEILLSQCKNSLIELCKELPKNLVAIVGLPIQIQNKLYNGAAFCFQGHILGVYLKTYLPTYNEFYESRWFTSGNENTISPIKIGEDIVPVSNHIVFNDITTKAKIAIEICEDLWVAKPVSIDHALQGANIIVNPSASNETIAKKQYRRNLVSTQSARLYAGYVYASAGTEESSSDLVFSGHNIIAENGTILEEMNYESEMPYIVTEIDLQHLENDRIHFKTSLSEKTGTNYIEVTYQSIPLDTIDLTRKVEPFPFVPQKDWERKERCMEILSLQAQGLATRLRKIHAQNVVIGISGGLDSTLALLVCVKAFEINGMDTKGIHTITMPGFGTTKRTKSNSDVLMKLLNTSSQTIEISDSVLQHFKDIHHDPSLQNITYENAQARERTQILMDLANKYNGIVIGTGDLSEMALGWCTYNGDHMSMYAVNMSIPKTLVRYIVETQALIEKEKGNVELYQVLQNICDTPVSPELLPPTSEGEILQKTEEVLGSYDLHDFYLYHMLRFHEEPKKIKDLCALAFPTIDKSTIKKSMQTFYQRFFSQQFKRNCVPDGIKIGSICLSPRGDWRMPSDANKELWMEELEN